MGIEEVNHWVAQKGWEAFPFQQECWERYLNGESGLLNAPTGSGKTYALWLACLASYIRENPDTWKHPKARTHLRVLWITPLRALTKDIARAMQQACDEIGIPWQVGVRTGDSSAKEREKLRKQLPECLLTTPETLHLLLAQKDYPKHFKNIEAVIVDEWHELIGSKRGVQIELGLSRLRHLQPKLRIWGISATIGNLEEAGQVLIPHKPFTLVKSKQTKAIQVSSIIPKYMERFPWVGHLGLHMIDQVLPILEKSQTTLLFTNTRVQTESWYQKLLEASPDLAGAMAMHHGSLSREVRDWVEDALHQGVLKVVVCTSSLDLGVDFRPVETVIQVGSPKGVARFLQRAGRSGHRPGALSNIYFLPTHALELLEGAALLQATAEISQQHDAKHIEARIPIRNAYDVLVQYLMTLAVSEGFDASKLLPEIQSTYCYQQMSQQEWEWCLTYITTGGKGLGAYEEFQKVTREGNFFKIDNRRVAMRHRLSMGTIVSEALVKVKLKKGGYVGTVEEYFISKLKEGEVFWFAGRNLEYVRLKDMIAEVKITNKKATTTPRWLGGRLPLSSELSSLLRKKIELAALGEATDREIIALKPLLETQRQLSYIPKCHEFLIEYTETEEGYHAYFYPFQGRLVHEIMAAVIAYRISQLQPITFSMAMNDYGFELLSDQEIPLEYALSLDLFTTDNLEFDLEQSMNKTETAKRKFREIAQIAGMLFQGYPGKEQRTSHLQASSSLLFDVFTEYDPESLLLKQAFQEVMAIQVQRPRLAQALEEISQQKIVLTKPAKPTPFAFPILVDRMREMLSTESLAERIAKLKAQ